jgi:hypothetical protein
VYTARAGKTKGAKKLLEVMLEKKLKYFDPAADSRD